MRDGSEEEAEADDLVRWAESLQGDLRLRHPRLREAAALFHSGDLGRASKLLRTFLATHRDDPGALRLLAETTKREGRNDEARDLFELAVKAAPDFTAARFAFAKSLLAANRPDAALAEIDALLVKDPRNPLLREQRALTLEALEHHAETAAIWRKLLCDYPHRAEWWLRLGHALRGIGQLDECIEAYRQALAIRPSFGAAWWTLADLKTFRFGDAEIGEMESHLASADLPSADRTRIHFALGKACEDMKAFEQSFHHYARGNALHRMGLSHDPAELDNYVARCKEFFTREFFDARRGWGSESNDPIFVVGMGRSGSTLVEQILASHPAIEGTGELTEIYPLARRLLAEFGGGDRNGFPGVLAKMSRDLADQLGREYLARAGLHRKLGRPHFADKMGANFANVGLIALILPNAKIIDVRRHPLACCFSNFAQLFPKGQEATYRLADIGRAYRDYVELMVHFDRVLPGKVHRVCYERLVGAPETEIRQMLDYLGLPFDEVCLRFYETGRVVTTISSQQVRNPIYHDAVERWRNYEPWLSPLKSALGPVLEAYPEVPAFD